MADFEDLGKYDPSAIEQKWYQFWEDHDVFHDEPDPSKEPYSIVLPPPNVTGQLHMGHALDNTLQDILIRYKRMQGYNVLWLPGKDHAGIATQVKVEKQIAEEGLNKYDLGREKFLERVWQWKEKYGNRIGLQIRRLGSSCDWKREASPWTMYAPVRFAKCSFPFMKKASFTRDSALPTGAPAARLLFPTLK